MSDAEQTPPSRCPYCAESLSSTVVCCPFCGETFTPPQSPRKSVVALVAFIAFIAMGLAPFVFDMASEIALGGSSPWTGLSLVGAIAYGVEGYFIWRGSRAALLIGWINTVAMLVQLAPASLERLSQDFDLFSSRNFKLALTCLAAVAFLALVAVYARRTPGTTGHPRARVRVSMRVTIAACACGTYGAWTLVLGFIQGGTAPILIGLCWGAFWGVLGYFVWRGSRAAIVMGIVNFATVLVFGILPFVTLATSSNASTLPYRIGISAAALIALGVACAERSPLRAMPERAPTPQPFF